MARGIRWLIFLFGISVSFCSNAQTCNLIHDNQVYSAPSIAKPNYLQSYIDPVFGTKVTRVTGDPGTAISSGGTWGSDVHHQYSLMQAWNADESLMFIETNSEGGTGSVFLDGNTFQPKFSHSVPGNECRWHPTDPTRMLCAGSNQVFWWNPATNTKSIVGTFSGYGGSGTFNGTSVSGLYIGHYKGNMSLDGSMVVLTGVGPAGNLVAFAYNLVTQQKYADIDLQKFGPNTGQANLDQGGSGTGISPLGDYIVVQSVDDYEFITDLNGNQLSNAGCWSKPGAFQQGHPSHWDMNVDQNGDEVAVGKAVNGAPYDGLVIKVRLKDGCTTPLTSGGYARHSSTRDTSLRGWGVSSMEPVTNYPPYNNEIVFYKLDGSVTYRIGHSYDLYYDYESEMIPSISPSGHKVVFASDWGSSTGRPVQVYVIDLTASCSFSNSSDTNPPSVPAGLSTTAVSSSQINLSWSPSTDNVGVAGYTIFRNGVSIANVNSTSYSDGGLLASMTYTYTVLAYDAASNRSAQSSPASATTLAASDTIPPTASITSPANGSFVTHGTSFQAVASASDNIGVTKVQFYQNGSLKCTVTAAPYTCGMAAPSKRGRTVKIQAYAYDAAGNIGKSAIVTATTD